MGLEGNSIGRGEPSRWGTRLLLAASLGLIPLAGEPPRAAADQEFEVPPPPLTEGIFPCTACHDNKSLKPNPERRTLGMHDDVQLRHGPASRWCLDCHDLRERDRLHLVNGERVDFTASYQLCGQCHGDKLRDWRAGIHGKRTGHWDGRKQYLLCVHCHNPHAPRFQALVPMPRPRRPEEIGLVEGGAR